MVMNGYYGYYGYAWLCMVVTHGYARIYMVMHGYAWLYMVTHDYEWLLWLCMVIRVMYMAVGG